MTKDILLTNLHNDPRSANRMAPERFNKLVESIKFTKRTQPLSVRPDKNNEGHFIIIDGHYRKKALEELNYTSALCDVWDINDDDSVYLLATLNRLQGEDHPKKRAELLENLLSRFEKERLIQLIPENKHELDNLLSILSEKEDITTKLVEQMETERQTLPVMLHFTVSKSDAELIQKRLIDIDPDQNKALVTLCGESLNDTTSVH